ncbi:M15 family metallopeptidase [Nocardioides sp.]|uniref:M15 family metallopeptidase n=1 Tax=Nocardioides sp. TaxID=35761 RepID=UPI003D0F4ECF
MSLGSVVTAVVLPIILVLGGGLPAYAAEPLPTTVSLTGSSVYADATSVLQIGLTDSTSAPVTGAQVSIERRTGGVWNVIGSVVTDQAGEARLSSVLSKVAADNVFRASYAGDADHLASSSPAVGVALKRRASVLTLGAPASVVDERSATLRIRWATRSGLPVSGAVRVQRRAPGGSWTLAATLRTGAEGRAQLVITPRVDTRWRLRAAALDWVEGAASGVRRIDNLPPNRPVTLPAAAPSPRVQVPAQPRATGGGANAQVSRIPDPVWSRMTGVSWHRGCPVGRAGLRYLTINYWDYDGYRRRGALVANADAVQQMAGALSEMYRRGLPLRSLYPVDRFGYSKRLHGGNDYRSMAAGNTSAFNCRSVVNKPGVRSPHSWGRSLDVNTWENPYRSATGLVPNSWWQGHSHPRVAWRSRSHPVVEIMAAHDLRWTYGLGDTQHFDAPAANGRVLVVPGCEACD